MELAWHLSSSDIWFLDGFLNAKFEMEDDSMPGDLSEVADIVALYEEQFDEKFPLVAKLSPEFWATPIPFFGIFNYPAVLYLQFMLNHAIHHRGQLCAYIREMGGKVPNIYGGSHDEPMPERRPTNKNFPEPFAVTQASGFAANDCLSDRQALFRSARKKNRRRSNLWQPPRPEKINNRVTSCRS